MGLGAGEEVGEVVVVEEEAEAGRSSLIYPILGLDCLGQIQNVCTAHVIVTKGPVRHATSIDQDKE